MSLIDKAYFTLEELEERWQLPHRDLVYLAENGLLHLSVRLFGVQMEFGVYVEGENGEWFPVPHERRRFTGFQDLQERDVFRVFRQGQVDVAHFYATDKAYCYLIEPRERSWCAAMICCAARSATESSRSMRWYAKARSHRRCSRRTIIARCASLGCRSISGPCRRASSSGCTKPRPRRIPGARESSFWAKPAPPAHAWPTSSSHSRIGAV